MIYTYKHINYTYNYCIFNCQLVSNMDHMDVYTIFHQELVASRDHRSSALQGIIVHLEVCSPHSTSVLWAHGVVRVDWKLKGSAHHVHRAGTVWLGLEFLQADVALDTSVLKVPKSVTKLFIL